MIKPLAFFCAISMLLFSSCSIIFPLTMSSDNATKRSRGETTIAVETRYTASSAVNQSFTPVLAWSQLKSDEIPILN
jgi:hypothetical protein